MDPEPASVPKSSYQPERSETSSRSVDSQSAEEEGPLGFSSPSIALLGVVIALVTVGIPIVAVITERPERESMVPTALKSNGSKTSFPFAL